MKKFNLALYPQNENFLNRLIETAQINFSNDEPLYLLGTNSLPHATLCQFLAKDDTHANFLIEAASELLPETVELKPTMVYFCPRTKEPSGLYYTGIMISKTKALVDLQKKIYNHLAKNDAHPLTNPDDDYWPHFTLALTSETSFDTATIENLPFEPLLSIPVLGDTGENGQLLNIRWQHPRSTIINAPILKEQRT